MAELYFKTFQDYMMTLCVQHKLLNHDASNIVFSKMQTHQDVGSLPNNAARYFVIMDDFAGRVVGEFDDNKIRQEAAILFLKVTEPGDDVYAAIETAQQLAMDVMFDIYQRIKHDFEIDDCGPLRYLLAEQMSFEPVGPVLENHFGWLMRIPFNSKLPAYDPDKWNIPD